MENEKEFMERLLREQNERKEAFKASKEENAVELKKLDLKPGITYQLEAVKAWGKQDDKYGDWMAIQFSPASPVNKGFKADGENVIYIRSGLMRTLRQRILRDVPDNPKYPELEAGVNDGEPILATVPLIDKPIKMQFAIEESTPKGGNARGFLQAWGEVVEDFGKFEKADGFIAKMKEARKEYLDSKKTSDDDGKKIGLKELGLNKAVHAVLTRAYAAKEDVPNYMIFRIDTEKSRLWDGYTPEGDNKYNRLHLSGLSLKTFVKNVLKLPAKENSPAVQVSVSAEGEPETVAVPLIPEGGVAVRFFRVERTSASGKTYHEVIGEVLKQ